MHSYCATIHPLTDSDWLIKLPPPSTSIGCWCVATYLMTILSWSPLSSGRWGKTRANWQKIAVIPNKAAQSNSATHRNEFSLRLVIHSNEGTVCPQETYFSVYDCVHENSFASYLCNGPHFSTSLSTSSTGRLGEEGGGGVQRLSEVTTLINKLARHTSVRRAICSQFVQCSGGTELSHTWPFVYSGIQLSSTAGEAENRKQESEKFMSALVVCCITHCLRRPRLVLACFIYSV